MRSLTPGSAPITIIADYDSIDTSTYDQARIGAKAIVLTQDGRLLLQERDDIMQDDLPLISSFGGGLEAGETLRDCLIRELNEELGAVVAPADLVWLGARVKQGIDGGWGLSAHHFWHDKNGTITGCYEGRPLYVMDAAEALAMPNLHDSVAWCLEQCQQFGLIG